MNQETDRELLGLAAKASKLPMETAMTDDAILGFLLALAYLWGFKFFGLWVWEVCRMKRKGYWLDDGFSGRGRYNPAWRHKDGALPNVKSKRVPF
jgi:hypothetical protein